MDLIGHGLRLRDLGTERLSWRDFKVLMRLSPPTSAVAQSADPEGAAWADINALLLRELVYEMQMLRYQQNQGKGQRPKRIPLPGEVNPDSSTYGSEALEIEDMADWLGGPFAALERQN